jgi:hypothetical protein
MKPCEMYVIVNLIKITIDGKDVIRPVTYGPFFPHKKAEEWIVKQFPNGAPEELYICHTPTMDFVPSWRKNK